MALEYVGEMEATDTYFLFEGTRWVSVTWLYMKWLLQRGCVRRQEQGTGHGSSSWIIHLLVSGLLSHI